MYLKCLRFTSPIRLCRILLGDGLLPPSSGTENWLLNISYTEFRNFYNVSAQRKEPTFQRLGNYQLPIPIHYSNGIVQASQALVKSRETCKNKFRKGSKRGR